MSWDRSNKPCPECQGETHQESADIGVGTIFGPRGCIECGWSESDEYNQLLPENREPDHKGGFKDQFGMYHPAGSTTAAAYRMARRDET